MGTYMGTVGPPGGGVNCRPGGGGLRGYKRGSVNFVLKKFLAKKGVFNEKTRFLSHFYDFVPQNSHFFIDFY